MSRCSTCRGSASSGRSTSRRPVQRPQTVEAGTTASIPITLTRSATFFERVTTVGHLAAGRLDRRPGAVEPDGLDGERRGRLVVAIPAGTPLGRLRDRGPGRQPGSDRDDDHPGRGRRGRLRPPRADRGHPARVDDVAQLGAGPRRLAGGDRPVERHRRVRGPAEPQWWPRGRPRSRSARRRRARVLTVGLRCDVPVPGAGRRRGRATGARGPRAPPRSRSIAFDDRSSRDRPIIGPGRARRAHPPTTAPETGVPRQGHSLRSTSPGTASRSSAPRGPQRGSVEVYHRRRLRPDGHPVVARRRRSRQVVFDCLFPGGGSHTITLRRRRHGHAPAVPARRASSSAVAPPHL